MNFTNLSGLLLFCVCCLRLVLGGLTNVALNKPTAISSLRVHAPPSLSVDGYKATKEQCTYSDAYEKYPWFRVDMEAEYIVEAVVVTNRGQYGSDNLDNLQVFVTDSVFDPYTAMPSDDYKCANLTSSYDGATENLVCTQPISGRYVTLVFFTTNKYGHLFVLCEVEVLAEVEGLPGITLTNVALNKPASQSSYEDPYNHPEYLVDGNKATNAAMCTKTASESNPWWRVDLQGSYTVKGFVLTNEGPCCGMDFALEKFDVYVTDEAFDPKNSKPKKSTRCFRNGRYIQSGVTVRFDCLTPVTGQFLTIVVDTLWRPLQICEVEVLAGVLDEPATGAADWYRKQCSDASDCLTDNADCYGNTCLCKIGYYYSVGSKTCVESCKDGDLQSSYSKYPMSQLAKQTLAKGDATSVKLCATSCKEYSKGGKVCRSFTRKSGKNEKCFLHEVTAGENTSQFRKKGKSWSYFQRNCA